MIGLIALKLKICRCFFICCNIRLPSTFKIEYVNNMIMISYNLFMSTCNMITCMFSRGYGPVDLSVRIACGRLCVRIPAATDPGRKRSTIGVSVTGTRK